MPTAYAMPTASARQFGGQLQSQAHSSRIAALNLDQRRRENTERDRQFRMQQWFQWRQLQEQKKAAGKSGGFGSSIGAGVGALAGLALAIPTGGASLATMLPTIAAGSSLGSTIGGAATGQPRAGASMGQSILSGSSALFDAMDIGPNSQENDLFEGDKTTGQKKQQPAAGPEQASAMTLIPMEELIADPGKFNRWLGQPGGLGAGLPPASSGAMSFRGANWG